MSQRPKTAPKSMILSFYCLETTRIVDAIVSLDSHQTTCRISFNLKLNIGSKG